MHCLDSGKDIVPSGPIEVAVDDLARLLDSGCSEYLGHPAFPGVTTRRFDLRLLPVAIRNLIASVGGQPTQFNAIRVADHIPRHQHVADGEIYFCGRNVAVSLFDKSGQPIGVFPIDTPAYALTMPGEAHAAVSIDDAGGFFLAVKFETA